MMTQLALLCLFSQSLPPFFFFYLPKFFFILLPCYFRTVKNEKKTSQSCCLKLLQWPLKYIILANKKHPEKWTLVKSLNINSKNADNQKMSENEVWSNNTVTNLRLSSFNISSKLASISLSSSSSRYLLGLYLQNRQHLLKPGK